MTDISSLATIEQTILLPMISQKTPEELQATPFPRLKAIIPAAAVALYLLLSGCGKDPCMKEWGCEDCNCLFDKYQAAAQTDLDRMTRIKECYDRACR